MSRTTTSFDTDDTRVIQRLRTSTREKTVQFCPGDKGMNNMKTILAAHVNDIVSACNESEECKSLPAYLSKAFSTNNSGKLKYYAG